MAVLRKVCQSLTCRQKVWRVSWTLLNLNCRSKQCQVTCTHREDLLIPSVERQRPDWYTLWFQGQSGVHSWPYPNSNKKKTNKQTNKSLFSCASLSTCLTKKQPKIVAIFICSIYFFLELQIESVLYLFRKQPHMLSIKVEDLSATIHMQ